GIGSNWLLGDPEWIGVLSRPGELHAADNQFISRYAYEVIPIGQSLDINTMHNQTLNTTLSATDGYMRNQGQGPWELNLAAFLVDLNTNEWGADLVNPAGPYYQYNQANAVPGANLGIAFDDARAILSYRYNNNYSSLPSASVLFPNNAAAFQGDNIDEYSDGSMMFSASNIDEALSPPDPVT